MIIGSRLSTFDNYNLKVYVDNDQINRVVKSKALGLTIDESLTWKCHIDDITKKVSSGIGALKRVRDSLVRKQQYKLTKV